MAEEVRRVKGASICFDCDLACGRCSWSANDPTTNKLRYEPVPGWTAEPSIISQGENAKPIHTYRVIACPQFRRTVRTRRSSPAVQKLLRECGELRACAWCGNNIDGGHPAARYCSDACRKAANEAVLAKKKQADDRGCPVIRTDPKTGEEKRFRTMTRAAVDVSGTPSRISYSCMTGRVYRGYRWRKESDTLDDE